MKLLKRLEKFLSPTLEPKDQATSTAPSWRKVAGAHRRLVAAGKISQVTKVTPLYLLEKRAVTITTNHPSQHPLHQVTFGRTTVRNRRTGQVVSQATWTIPATLTHLIQEQMPERAAQK